MLAGIFLGIFNFLIFAEYGAGFFIGAKLVENSIFNGNSGRDYDIGDIVSIFFSVINGAFAFGSVGPSMEALAKAKEAAF